MILLRAIFRWCLAVGLASCTACGAPVGRVAVILDNSTSMEETGTPFEEVKQSVFDSLLLVPGTTEVGLRVFQEGGSELVVPYSPDLDRLRSGLAGIHPSTGTYIGQSLLAAAGDLVERPKEANRLILITDGEGEEGDFEMARAAGNLLRQKLSQPVRCDFVVFSPQKELVQQTYIGRIAELLGCKVTVPGAGVTGASLTRSLQGIVGAGFYPIWILVSLVLYLALLLLTARLIFDTQFAQGVLPRIARGTGSVFFLSTLVLVTGAHLVAILASFAGWIGLFVALALGALALTILGIGRGRSSGQEKSHEQDPFH